MFPSRLKELRLEKKKTHQDMADFLGLTRQGYAKYEHGLSQPDIQTIIKLAEYFNVPIDYLLGRTIEDMQKEREQDEWGGLSEDELVFFKNFQNLSEEDKQGAMKYIKFLKYLAELKNKGEG